MTSQWEPMDLDAAASEWATENADTVHNALVDTYPTRKQGESKNTVEQLEAEPNGPEIDAYGGEVAGYLMTGTEPHEIHGKPWLVFEGDDGMVFLNNDLGKFVHHPGTDPNDYVDRAMDNISDDLSDRLLDKLAEQWSAA